jgi:hypothetical protein
MESTWSAGRDIKGMHTIALSEFGDLMESMGTMYCKEEHQKTLKELNKLGDKIHEYNFVAWYVGWLFWGQPV